MPNESGMRRKVPEKQPKEQQNRQIPSSEQQLAHSRARLRLESAYAGVQLKNDRLLTVNEELQASQAQLQRTNEELTLLNEQLQKRNFDLSVANGDLANVFNNVAVPVIILDRDLRIRRFTAGADKVLNLMPADVGRPLPDIRLTIDAPGLEDLVSESIRSAGPRDCEVRDRQGRWYSLRIKPYQTAENKVDGAVITLWDIHLLKAQENATRMYAEAIVETVRESILVLDSDLRVRVANRCFFETFQVSPLQVENRFIYELGNGQWDIPRLRELLHEILSAGAEFKDFEVDHAFPSIGKRTMVLNARPIRHVHGVSPLILLAIQDATEQRRAEKAVRQVSGRLLTMQDEERRRIARDLHDSTAQTLSALALNLAAVQSRHAVSSDPAASKAVRESEALAKQAGQEIRNLSHLLHPPDLDLVGLIAAVRWYATRFTERNGILLHLDLPAQLNRLPQEVEIALFRIMQESLANVHHHSGSAVATVRIGLASNEIWLEVGDKGCGIPPGAFPDDHQNIERLGVGIAGMKERLRQLGGRMEISSSHEGTNVRAIVPLRQATQKWAAGAGHS